MAATASTDKAMYPLTSLIISSIVQATDRMTKRKRDESFGLLPDFAFHIIWGNLGQGFGIGECCGIAD
jgi:hypothetical protein